MRIDLAVANRQSFGAGFKDTPRDDELRLQLTTGVLKLHPHPSWSFDPLAIDWEANPFNQRNWRAQYHMLRWLDPLRRCAIRGDQEARQTWLRYARSWSVSNLDPGAVDQFVWMDMVDAMRAIELALGTVLIGEEDEAWLTESLVTHGEWLCAPENLGHSNHALHQHQALFVLGRLLGRRDWWQLAVDRLRELFRQSYDEQGVNDGGSIAYHKMNLQWWTDAFRRLEVESIALPAEADRLRLAHLELAHATRPDGTLERIGDTENTRASGLQSPELDYVLSKGSKGIPPSERAVVYARGYVFGRSGWGDQERDFEDETFYSISFGSSRRVHGHADGGGLTLFSRGVPWLVDTGKYGYLPDDPMRRFAMSREAHNIVVIRGSQYKRGSVVQMVHYATGPEIDDYAFIDLGYEGVELRRRVLYCRGGDFIVVIDDVSADRDVNAQQLWHLSPDAIVTESNGGFEIRIGESEGRILWAQPVPDMSTVKGQTDPYQGWVSDRWATKEPAPTIIAERVGAQLRFITVIGAVKRNDLALREISDTGETVLISVNAGRTDYHLRVSSDYATVTVGDRPLHSDASETPVDTVRNRAEKVLGEVTGAAGIRGGLQHLRRNSARHLARHVRRSVRAEGGSVAARLEAVTFLMDYYNEMGRPESDHGIRAAIVDIASQDLMRRIGTSPSELGVLRQPLLGWASSPSTLRHELYGCDIIDVSDRGAPAQEPLRASIRSDETIYAEEVEDIVLSFIAKPGDGDVLYVRFHGAINRAKSWLPLYQGLSTDRAAGRPYAIFPDPSLDLDSGMNLAWYLGKPELNLHHAIAERIAQIAEKFGKSRVLLTGSSGGGFAAIQVASYLPDAFVVVFNPQTDVRRYYKPTAVRALRACFHVDDLETVPPALKARVSLASRLENYDGNMEVFYFQNKEDVHHVQYHYDPLRTYLRERRSDLLPKFHFKYVDWGPGHKAVSAENYRKIVDRVVEHIAASQGSS